MEDLTKLTDQVSMLNTQVEVANNTSKHMATDLDEIKAILQKSTDTMNKIFLDHSMKITRLQDSDEGNKKKISELQLHVETASSNINNIIKEFETHKSYTNGIVDGVKGTINWIKFVLGGSVLAGIGAVAKAFFI